MKIPGQSEDITKLARAIAIEVRRLLGEPDAYLSKRDAAKYLTLSLSNFDARMHEIPHSKIGSRPIFRRSELDMYVNQHRVEVKPDQVSAIVNDIVSRVKRDQKLKVTN